MILALLGTNPYSFSRLAEAIDEYSNNTGEDCFIQLGHTQYIPKHARFVRFLKKQDLMKRIEEADLIVTQGGFGSIADCLRAGKKVVAVPRKPEMGESPDRQEELVRELENFGRIVGVFDIQKLPAAIERAKTENFDVGKKSRIPEIIHQFILDNC